MKKTSTELVSDFAYIIEPLIPPHLVNDFKNSLADFEKIAKLKGLYEMTVDRLAEDYQKNK